MRRTSASRSLAALLLVHLAGCGVPTRAQDNEALAQLLPAAAGMGGVEPPSAVESLLSSPFTIEAAVRFAYRNSPRVKATLARLGISRNEWAAAISLPAPHLSAAFGDTAAGGSFALALPLAPLLEREDAVGIARASHLAARARAANAILEVGLQVRLAALEVVATREALHLAEERLAIATAEREAADALFDAGNLPPYERLLHRREAETAALELADATLAVQQSRRRLELLLPLPPVDEDWTIIAPSASPDLDARVPEVLEAGAEAASLGLAAQRATLRALAHRIGRAERARWLPGLALELSREGDATDGAVGAELSVTLPVTGESSAVVASEQAAFEAALADFEVMRAATRSAVNDSWYELRTAVEMERIHTERLLPLQESLLREDTLRYNAMEEGLFGLLEQRRQLAAEATDALHARVRRWRAEATLAFLREGGTPRAVAAGDLDAGPTSNDAPLSKETP